MTFRREFVVLLIIVTVVTVCFLLNPLRTSKKILASEEKKIILDWTGFYNRPLKESFSELLQVCPPIPKCQLTNNRTYLNQSAAVVFHLPDVEWDLTDKPLYRNHNQRFIMFSFESPLNTVFNLDIARNYFNWTMSYRRDSDIWFPHGFFRRKKLSPKSDNWKKRLMDSKKKLVAWFASNCVTSSKREKYVEIMNKFINVDTYGKCGTNFTCPKSKWESCEWLLAEYKFYLSFENSICTDYITEKFFMKMRLYNLVPIVLRRKDYTEIAPEHSYIAADDFGSPEALSKHLNYLNRNITAYLDYFKWRGNYEIIDGFGYNQAHFCQLCKMLHNSKLPHKIISNPDKWWNEQTDCQDKFSLSLLNANNE